MKKGLLLTAVLAAALFSSSTAMAGSSVFSDIGQSYAKDEIMQLYDQHVIDGTQPGLFEPTKAVSRAEFVKMLAGVIGLSPVNNSIAPFRDVQPTDWSFGWIYAAFDLGIVDGKSDTSFQPNQTITREEAAAVLARALKLPAASQPVSYLDAAAISGWALPYVQTATEAGLIQGYNQSFYPQDELTREEAAVLLKRVGDRLQNNTAAQADTYAGGQQQLVIGWQYGSTDADFEGRLRQSSVNVAVPRWFFLNKDGTISNNSNTALSSWVHDNGKQVWALVGNRFDPDVTHQFLTTYKADAVKKLTDAAVQAKLNGLNLDFENVRPEDRDLFTQFVDELAQSLHSSGLSLSVDVPPDSQTDWSQPYDFAALSQKADYLIMMDYEEHYEGSGSMGSVASLPWFVSNVQQLLKDQVAPDKLIVGTPLYGRDWWSAGGKLQSEDVTLQDQDKAVTAYSSLSWDPAAEQYVAGYTAGGVKHNVWLEDSRSLSAKDMGLSGLDLAGTAFWYVGDETNDIWTAINNAARYHQIILSAMKP